MVWRKREKDDLPPNYGHADNFTIKLHHHGKLCKGVKLSYEGGQVDYFDYCNSDEMSMLEIKEMTADCGIDPEEEFYFFNKDGADDCNRLTLLDSDTNALNLAWFQEKISRCVGVFVDHGGCEDAANETNEEYDEAGDDGDDECNNSDFYFDDEYSLFDGDQEDLEKETNEDEEVDVVSGEALLDKRTNRYEVEDYQSVGEDSDHSEVFIDSDGVREEDEFKLLDQPKTFPSMNTKQLVKPTPSMRNVNPNEPVLKYPIEHYGGLKVFNPTTDMADPRFHCGDLFEDADVFRTAVRQHSILHKRELNFPINERTRVQVKCANPACAWYMYVSSFKGETYSTLQVKTFYGPHTCDKVEKLKAANSKWLAKKYELHLTTDPKWSIGGMKQVMEKEVGVTLSRFQMHRVKKKVKEMGMGSQRAQYAAVWRYANEIMKSDPHSTVRIKPKVKDGDNHFSRIYICWGQLKRGMLSGCRKVLCLDGCHLKTECGGILLTAIGIDPNNGMYPVAYAVVEKEKKETWMWFLEYLQADLGIITDSSDWTFMTDKQKGLEIAISELFPNSDHRVCVLHMYNNFKAKHKGLALKKILWRAARSSTVYTFEEELKKMKDKSMGAFTWLCKRPVFQWTKAYFRIGAKSDILLNNLCETFNKLILEARSMPIIDMLESIRIYLMKRLWMKRDAMTKWNGVLCPRIQEKLEDLRRKGSNGKYHCLYNGDNQFEVIVSSIVKYKVDLNERMCGCRLWQLTGMPCSHVMKVIHEMGYVVEDYVDDCYKKSTYLRVYDYSMKALNGFNEWPYSDQPKLLPPIVEVLPGRPKLHARKKSPQEIEELKNQLAKEKAAQTGKLGKHGGKVTCSYCLQKGHNRRGCPIRKKNIPKEPRLDVPPPVEGSPSQPTSKVRKRKEVVHNSGSGVIIREKLQVRRKLQVRPNGNEIPTQESVAGTGKGKNGKRR